MRRTIPLTLMATATLICATASAQPSGLTALDSNGDGTIGRQEALEAQVKAFHRMDADGDGQISASDLESAQAAPHGGKLTRDEQRARREARRRWLKQLDRDDSGTVSLDEYQAAMTPYFDRLDRNNDGVLDGPELRQALKDDRGG